MSDRNVIVLTAPSGAGKTTIARRVMAEMPELSFSVSATTREARPGEVHGVDYFFLSEDEFRRRVESGEVLEYEEVYPGQLYGTLASEVEQKARDGGVLLDIDVRGAQSVKDAFGDDALVIFVAPPSMETLRRRLNRRGTESDRSMRERLDRAEMEMDQADRFDAVVVNDDLGAAVEETLQVVRQFLNS
jgi:guanylate kinase